MIRLGRGKEKGPNDVIIGVSSILASMKIKSVYRVTDEDPCCIDGLTFDDVVDAEEVYIIYFKSGFDSEISFHAGGRKWFGQSIGEMPDCPQLDAYRAAAIHEYKIDKWYKKLMYVRNYIIEHFDNSGTDVIIYMFSIASQF